MILYCDFCLLIGVMMMMMMMINIYFLNLGLAVQFSLVSTGQARSSKGVCIRKTSVKLDFMEARCLNSRPAITGNALKLGWTHLAKEL